MASPRLRYGADGFDCAACTALTTMVSVETEVELLLVIVEFPLGLPASAPLRLTKYIWDAPSRVPDATLLSITRPPVAQQPFEPGFATGKPLPDSNTETGLLTL